MTEMAKPSDVSALLVLLFKNSKSTFAQSQTCHLNLYLKQPNEQGDGCSK